MALLFAIISLCLASFSFGFQLGIILESSERDKNKTLAEVEK